MDTETVALLGGLLFLLLALVGGGFTIREIIMPQIPTWARVACLAVGAGLLLRFVLVDTGAGDDRTPADAAGGSPTAQYTSPDGRVVLRKDDGPHQSPEGIELTGLVATSNQETPDVGDEVTLEFSLENVSGETLTLEETFIGIRNPENESRDDAHENEGRVFAAGDVIDVNASIVVDSAGMWTFWPCYLLDSGSGCPDTWRRIEILVD